MSRPARLRLFVGIPLPEPLVEPYARLQRALAELGGVKWVERENLHLTLKFLGGVEVSSVPEVRRVLEAAAAGAECATLRARRVTAFPTPRAARVLIVELEDPAGAVTRLQGEIERGLAGLGFAPEERGFRTHVTLGRVREGKANAAVALEAVAAPRGAWEVRSFDLIESRLGPRGQSYSALKSFPLR